MSSWGVSWHCSGASWEFCKHPGWVPLGLLRPWQAASQGLVWHPGRQVLHNSCPLQSRLPLRSLPLFLDDSLCSIFLFQTTLWLLCPDQNECLPRPGRVRPGRSLRRCRVHTGWLGPLAGVAFTPQSLLSFRTGKHPSLISEHPSAHCSPPSLKL